MFNPFKRTLLIAALFTCCGSALAQEQRLDYEARRAREKMSDDLGRRNLAGPQPDAVTAARDAAERRREFLRQDRVDRLRQALQQFQAGRDELLQSLTSKSKLKNPARRIEKSTATFIDLLPKPGPKPSFDSDSLKGFTQTELGWEALTSAERLTRDLLIYIASESAQITDLQLLRSLPKLHAELIRLRWIAQKLR